MKPILSSLGLLGILLFPIALAQAEAEDSVAPVTPTPKMIQVQVEFVELPHKALTKLLFLSKPTSSDATDLRKKLQEIVDKDQAEVLETLMVVARTGQKATTESIHEFIYPTEYEPPALPCSIPDHARTSVAPGEHALPTAFDTRNLGSTLEVEPTLSLDEKIVDLRLVPEIVWHTGNTVWLENKDALGNPNKVEMPDMFVIRCNTSVTCVPGQYMMAAVLSPKNAQGDVDMTRKVVIFVKCDVLTAK